MDVVDPVLCIPVVAEGCAESVGADGDSVAAIADRDRAVAAGARGTVWAKARLPRPNTKALLRVPSASASAGALSFGSTSTSSVSIPPFGPELPTATARLRAPV